MKAFTTLSLLVLSVNSVVVRRQNADGLFPGLQGLKIPGFDLSQIAKSLPKGGLAGLLKPEVKKAYKIEEMKPLVNPQAKRIKITYGPYKIRAANVSSFVSLFSVPAKSNRAKKAQAIPSQWIRLVRAIVTWLAMISLEMS
jgi:hypothetical protein